MAKSHDKPDITTDDIEKTKAYADAVNNLNTSLTGVNSALPKFADGFETGLKAIAEKLPDVVAAMTNLNVQNKELASNGQKPVSVLTQLGTALLSWNSALSVGITLITAYAPKILSFIGKLFDSSKARAAAQALKDYNDVWSSYTRNLALETSELQTLLSVAKNESIAKETRLEAIKKLNDASPAYLSSLTLANVQTKQGTEAVNEYVKALKRKSFEESAQSKMTELLKARMDLSPGYQAAKSAVTKFRSEKAKDPNAGKSYFANQGSALGTGSTIDYADLAEKEFKKYVDKDAALTERIKNLKSLLASQLVGLAPKASPQQKPEGKNYWLQLLESEEADLDKLDAGAKDFEAKANPIIEKIKRTKKMLSKYVVADAQIKINTNDHDKNIASDDKPIGAIQIEALADDFAKRVEITNQGYEAELAALKQQLDKKLITQQQYEQQSEALKTKYHQNIGDQVEAFRVQDLDNAKKHLQDLAEQAHLAEAIPNDQEKIKKAVLPADKLAADKELITDKYDLEISLAKGNADKIKQLEQSKQQDITELNKRYTEERKDFEVKTAQEVSNAAFSILQNSIKSQSEAKIKQLETQKASELNNSSLTSSQKKAIEDKYAKKEAEEKTKAFKAEQKASILQAVINGALAITKVTAQTGVASAFIIPSIIAETAIQVATIAAQKAPQYAKGGVHYQSDGRGALLPGYSRTDNMNAQLRSGEAVVVSEAMRDPWARNLVSAINVAYGGRDFSVANPSRGYAIGGIFTDGGNSNRYYNAPMNDQKDLANTIAYQMINNFPPVYVDVKDINNQQSILAQTINRVNL
ncbi:hypothetical protein ACFS5N_00175 [Mucilaginibacter ximonensis]|uniref:Uncharacterized protein n=1 Tax=Mucilaginibacter ximonensis TaxID=538021 RepID=A0ABW5Y749_9SPHI